MRSGKRAGFTIMELMVSTAIVLVAISVAAPAADAGERVAADAAGSDYGKQHIVAEIIMEVASASASQIEPGIFDVRSSSKKTSLEGTPYSEW